MKLQNALSLLMVAFVEMAAAQGYNLYSDDSLVLQSTYLQGKVRLSLHLPETHRYASPETTYPIALIFDSQHEQVYPQLIQSFDLLTNESQIPETILVGIPFTLANRRYLTSNQTVPGDSLSGMQRLELFIFQELLPHLKSQRKGNDFLALFGHSRTAFLANYLCYTHPNQVSLTGSFSGFYDNEPLSIKGFYDFLTNDTLFQRPFLYFTTAGSTLEESSYADELLTLEQMIEAHPMGESKAKARFAITPHANHMTNYWMSVPGVLCDAFSSYTAILTQWFHAPLDSMPTPHPLEKFALDLREAGSDVGFTPNPSITQIYSLASLFAYQLNNHEIGIQFLELGLKYYPNYLSFYPDIIEFSKATGNKKRTRSYQKTLREKVEKSPLLSDEERQAYLDYLREP